MSSSSSSSSNSSSSSSSSLSSESSSSSSISSESSSSSSSSISSFSSSSSSSSNQGRIDLCSGDIYVFPLINTTVKFKYCNVVDSTATILINSQSFLVGDYNGSFIWDQGGDGEYVFSDPDEFVIRYIGTKVYTITYDGRGSLLFTVMSSDYSNRTIPFIIETETINPVWKIIVYNGIAYAGTGSDGILLKSIDRQFWSKIYTVDDVHIKALSAQNNTLFIGTASKGQIYTMNLTTGTASLSQELGGEIYDFIYYQNNMYAAGGNPTQIYKYNALLNTWNSIYQTPSSQISKMIEFDGKMYVFMNDSNFVSFDGTYWTLADTGINNLSSFRNVKTRPYSHISNNFLDTSNVKSVEFTNLLDDEDVYDIFPLNYIDGVKGVDVDGGSFVIGSSNYGRIYNYYDNTIFEIFQTESQNTVNSILNLSVGVNLASVDNKLYLIYCGDLPTEVTEVLVPLATTTTTTTPISVIGITFPQGGEAFQAGDTITIQWVSNKSASDVVKIELYQDDEVTFTINGGTTNDGSYEWLIPNAFLPNNNFSIRITWLSSGDSDENYGLSGNFSIGVVVPVTTTTTTTPRDIMLPDTSKCVGVALLEFRDDEYITDMAKDSSDGGILLATSKGRILGCRQSLVNAYLTGEREVFAEVKDWFGNISNTASSTFFYSLYNKIAEINEDKEVVKWVFKEKPTAILVDRITGIFLSPILNVAQDLNLWKQLIWREIKPDDTEIVICIRSADNEDDLKALPWDYCFTSRDSDRGYGATGFIIRDLNSFQIKGKYLQFKVTMVTDIQNISPVILDLTVSYSTSFAVYFFTTKFTLENNANSKTGLITANITEPINTEVQFGIADENTSDWNDYTVVDPNKLFALGNFENMKVGIKMIAYDNEIPEVAEFAVMTGADINSEINR